MNTPAYIAAGIAALERSLLTDDDAVDAENNRHQGAHNHAADDQWDDLPVPGGDAA
jgi:hypothetical protein